MKKYLLILVGSVFLSTSAFAGGHLKSGGRDNMTGNSCFSRFCKNYGNMTSKPYGHMHATVFVQSSKINRELRRLQEKGGRRQ